MKFDLLIRSLTEGTKYIDLQKKLETNAATFTFYPPLWRLFNKKLAHITFNWQHLEFSSNADPLVAASTPGMYLFVLKPPYAIFEGYNHIMYVGMSEEGLIERLNKGYRTPSSVKQRPHVWRLILDYGLFLRWYYLPLPGLTNSELKEVESFLIGYFCDPPINRKDEPTPIKEAKKAKMST
ncbi:MAG: hypothetical protein JWO44_2779 [Bacteroidetes bacterium]|nr:hypothetical protein [Bacteroidota bacterium]